MIDPNENKERLINDEEPQNEEKPLIEEEPKTFYKYDLSKFKDP